MREVEAELAARGVAVAVVSFDRGPLVDAYVRETGLEWPVLVDRERVLYRGYGMERGRAWDLYGPPAIACYFKLFAKGRWLKRPGEDVTQLGGDVLIGPDGRLRLVRVGKGPADRPAVASILAVHDRG